MEKNFLKELFEGITTVAAAIEKRIIISDLPAPIKELALKRQFELKGKVDSAKEILRAFHFDQTPEEALFWVKIANGDYSPFYEKFPGKKPADKPAAPPEFKNGEEVEVYNHKNCEWIEGKFIGMNGDLFVAWVLGEGFSSFTDCRKLQPKEKETVKEDKNALVGNISVGEMAEFSRKIFGNVSTVQIIKSETPEDKPELKNRALYVPPSYEVVTGKSLIEGTYIAIYKK